MLKLEIPAIEVYDEADNTFKTRKGIVLSLEHSLVSVSKWESKWCVPFLSKRDKSEHEIIDYIKCMTLTQNVDDSVYAMLTQDNYDAIRTYIDAPMSATTIANQANKPSREIITSEIIYYWMVALNIPFECQKWHLNRLLMLINVCSIKQQKPTKLSGRSLAKSNAALNAQRRAMLNSGG
jgi:hypothetical protein